ncbi:hypothetical protein B1R38_18195 [Bacillus cereus]|uniref:DUF4365 domain-containing protein n=1 Tax=Bacillus cereus TaxID=1396 RepID=UPI000D66A59A|nr:DUF4365 domain-containing protein [Bacillus cereus]PWE72165.1 hypothetical protein B1R38_18195 [Bacillus cereus]
MSGKEKRTLSEQQCINKVREVVAERFNGEFIEFPQRMDNGFDGAIFWRENGNIIDAIYVQCKGGDSYLPVRKDGKFRIQRLTKEYVTKHKEVWSKVASPAILVVTDSNKKAWWIDLKSNDSYNATGEELYGDSSRIFNSKAKKDLKNLLSKKLRQDGIPKLKIKSKYLSNYLQNISLKESSQKLYKQLANGKMESNCAELDGKIKFTRVGWRHMTRAKRSKERIIQSLLLLPVVKEIINNASDYEKVEAKYYKDASTGSKVILEKLVIQAQCSFNYRFPSIVRVVLLRKREFNTEGETEKVWFYSVYEARRKKYLEQIIG